MKWMSRTNCVTEIPFVAAREYADPYNDVDLEVHFQAADGTVFKVPAFWAGERSWKVRFAPPSVGEYRYVSCSSNVDDPGLHGQTGAVLASPYAGKNPLITHGRLRVSADKRRFEYADGQPFFWIADTWWMGLSTRLDWPQGFKELTADRVKKGFNTIQIVAGPYPDMEAWDPRNFNEAGSPFTENFAGINPDYYNHADLKIGCLVESGLMPCIVGMWGYYLPQIGVERAKKFWRYLIARYAAYPVTWCICGEAAMPYYLSPAPQQEAEAQKKGWTEVMRSVREIDPFKNLITIHPTQRGREQVEDPSLMDFEMLQTGHGGMASVKPTIECVRKSVDAEPIMPVIVSEVNYEGILGDSWQNVQRLCFYHSIFNGAAGHTYGANGIWQMSTIENPYGPSPHGRCWGNTPWSEAAKLPGSAQVALGAAFMASLPWKEIQRNPEWVGESSEPHGAVAIGIPRRLRVVYMPMCWTPALMKDIESDVAYRAFYFDPCTGQRVDLGSVTPNADGAWQPPFPPEVHDWILVVEAL